ncbi:CCDC42 [Branchiostoma lanceolatum]|uniref:CCDC42 protein n=2 Tax=Branchiostoma lanceolatum TaxID=7740 RepID=A0A8J9ZRK1_BRALA|nr:CCDC42 [Branchiostoma lanceolatum]
MLITTRGKHKTFQALLTPITVKHSAGKAVIMANPFRLNLEQPKRNVFVTQLGEREDEELEDDIHKYPVVKESAGRLLENGFRTLQKTLLLKKEVEVQRVDEELSAKRAEFHKRMETCKQRQLELQNKQQKIKDRVQKFEKFITENDAKRRRAIQKYQTELKLNEQKANEQQMLEEQLEQLKIRHDKLQNRLEQYKKFEAYLLRVIDNMPEGYLEVGDSMINATMMRYDTLHNTNMDLARRVNRLMDQSEEGNQRLQRLKAEHEQKKVQINKDLSELQANQEKTMDANKKMEQDLQAKSKDYVVQSTDLAQILLAVDNISEKCLKRRTTPLDELSYLQKLQMIKDSIMERIAVEELAKTIEVPKELQVVHKPEPEKAKKVKSPTRSPQQTAKDPPKSLAALKWAAGKSRALETIQEKLMMKKKMGDHPVEMAINAFGGLGRKK